MKTERKNYLDWVSPSVASDWPEGSRILMGLTDLDGKIAWNTVELSKYHRPDWCNIKNENYNPFYGECVYFLLDRT